MKIEKFEYDYDNKTENAFGIKLKGGYNFEQVCKVLGIDMWTAFGDDYAERYGIYEMVIECAEDYSWIQYVIGTENGDSILHDEITFEEFCNVLLRIQ